MRLTPKSVEVLVEHLLGRDKPTHTAAIELPATRARLARRGYLAVMAMIRNEALDLREWLAFQRVVGVEHVYLYDDVSTDGTDRILAPFVQEGFVTLIPWSEFAQGSSPDFKQYLAYAHALCTFGPAWRWMAFIDRDEYLFPVNGGTLGDALRAYEDLPAVVVPWYMFGDNGHDRRPEGLVISNYTQRLPFPPPPVSTGLLKWKSIVNPSAVTGVATCHFFQLNSGEIGGYTEDRHWVHRMPGGWAHSKSEVFRINHYFTQSKEDFSRRRFKDRVDTPEASDDAVERVKRIARVLESSEHVEDCTILQYAPAVASALGVAL